MSRTEEERHSSLRKAHHAAHRVVMEPHKTFPQDRTRDTVEVAVLEPVMYGMRIGAGTGAGVGAGKEQA